MLLSGASSYFEPSENRRIICTLTLMIYEKDVLQNFPCKLKLILKLLLCTKLLETVSFSYYNLHADYFF